MYPDGKDNCLSEYLRPLLKVFNLQMNDYSNTLCSVIMHTLFVLTLILCQLNTIGY
jgi:antibiotic biosynthesis monooxygenase (ABM) superfamily enzyme